MSPEVPQERRMTEETKEGMKGNGLRHRAKNRLTGERQRGWVHSHRPKKELHTHFQSALIKNTLFILP